MAKGFRFISIFIIPILFISIINGQERNYNSHIKPISLIKRLSYENFKSIKLLQTAIHNYGGGEAEVDRLVDQYSEASALYFQNKYNESANLFTQNSREILKVSQSLAKKYRTDTEVLVKKGLKFNIKNELKNSIKGKKTNKVAEKFLSSARFAYSKAQNLYDGFINTKNAPPQRLIDAIYYFRRAKESVLLMFQYSQMNPDGAKDEEMKRQMMEQYKKDIQDNKNKIFKTREKKN